MKEIEIPRVVYRLPRREIERMAEEIRGGLDGDGSGVAMYYHPLNVSPRLMNDEDLTVQLKVTITYGKGHVFLHRKALRKPTAKATYTSPVCNLQRMEWTDEGLLLVPYGNPYPDNPDVLIVPEGLV